MSENHYAYALANVWKRIIVFATLVLFLYLAVSLVSPSGELSLFVALLAACLLVESGRADSRITGTGFFGGRIMWISLLWGFLLIFVYLIIFFIAVLIAGYEIKYTGISNSGYFLMASGLMIVSATNEELIFRGVIYQALIQKYSWLNVSIASSLIFALLHFLYVNFSLIAFINIFLASMLLYSAYQMTRTLWLPIIWHAGWNLMQSIILASPVSGFDYQLNILKISYQNSLFLGQLSYGIESGLAATLCLILTIPVIIRYLKADPEHIAFNINREYSEFLLTKKKKKN